MRRFAVAVGLATSVFAGVQVSAAPAARAHYCESTDVKTACGGCTSGDHDHIDSSTGKVYCSSRPKFDGGWYGGGSYRYSPERNW